MMKLQGLSLYRTVKCDMNRDAVSALSCGSVYGN